MIDVMHRPQKIGSLSRNLVKQTKKWEIFEAFFSWQVQLLILGVWVLKYMSQAVTVASKLIFCAEVEILRDSTVKRN